MTIGQTHGHAVDDIGRVDQPGPAGCDLLLEVVDGFAELPVEPTGQTLHDYESHSPQRLVGRPAASKRFRQVVAQVKEMKILALG